MEAGDFPDALVCLSIPTRGPMVERFAAGTRRRRVTMTKFDRPMESRRRNPSAWSQSARANRLNRLVKDQRVRAAATCPA